MSELKLLEFTIISELRKLSKDFDYDYYLEFHRLDGKTKKNDAKWYDDDAEKHSIEDIDGLNKHGLQQHLDKYRVYSEYSYKSTEKMMLDGKFKLNSIVSKVIDAMLHVPNLKIAIIQPNGKIVPFSVLTLSSSYTWGRLLIKYCRKNNKRIYDLVDKICMEELKTNDEKVKIEAVCDDDTKFYIKAADDQYGKNKKFVPVLNIFDCTYVEYRDSYYQVRGYNNNSNGSYNVLNCSYANIYNYRYERITPINIHILITEFINRPSLFHITYDQNDDEYWDQTKDIRTEVLKSFEEPSENTIISQELESRIMSLKKQYDTEIEQIKTDHVSKLSEAESITEQLKTVVSSKTSEITSLKQEIEDLKTELSKKVDTAAVDKIPGLESQNAELAGEVFQLADCIQKLKIENKKLLEEQTKNKELLSAKEQIIAKQKKVIAKLTDC